MEAVLDLNRQHLQSMTDTVTNAVTANIAKLIAVKEEEKLEGKNQNTIRDQCAHIERCDGLVTEDIREWLRNVNLAVQNTQGIPHNVRRIIRKTTTGQLYRAVERWCLAQPPDGVTWTNLSRYVQDSFLGTNEAERLRLDLAKVKQGADGILMFNRKYRELAEAAYGERRGAEAERTVIRHYLTALKDHELSKKVILESNATTLAEVITYVDKMAMGLELFNTMFEEEPMDCSMVDKEKTATDKSDLEKKLEKQNTKIAKLQAQVQAMSMDRSPPSRPGRRITCYQCGKEGHVRRDCPKNQLRPQPRWRAPPVSGQGHGKAWMPRQQTNQLPPVGHGRSRLPLN